MPCVYCNDDPTLQTNCYCRGVANLDELLEHIRQTSEFAAEAEAVEKVAAEYRRAKKAGETMRCYQLKVAMNYPPRRFTEIVKTFNL